MFEEYLITHCSPTLASLKPASLFLYRFSSGEELYESVAVWDAQFQKKGIRITILREDTETALIYVYRPDAMVRELSRPEIISFLVSTGYQAGTIDQMLEQLRSRLHGSEEFPHEIGVFLGYPLMMFSDLSKTTEVTAKAWATGRYTEIWVRPRKHLPNLKNAVRSMQISGIRDERSGS